jgi:hypothetical protein
MLQQYSASSIGLTASENRGQINNIITTLQLQSRLMRLCDKPTLCVTRQTAWLQQQYSSGAWHYARTHTVRLLRNKKSPNCLLQTGSQHMLHR